MKLQNKKIKNKQLNIFSNLSLIDIAVGLTITAISFLIIFTLIPSLVTWIKIVLIIPIIILLIPLLQNYEKFNAKGYKIFVLALIHFFRIKKYSADKSSSSAAHTKNLVPYKKMVKHFIKTKNSFFGAIKISGKDIWINNQDTINNFLDEFTKALNQITSKITIVKIPQRNDLSKNLKYLKEFEPSEQPFGQAILDEFQQEFNQFEDFVQKDNYYIVFYEKNAANLHKQLLNFQQNLNNLLINSKILNAEELINLELQVVNPASAITKEEIKELKKHPEKIQLFSSQSEIQFKAKHFKIGENFYSTQAIVDYPFQLSPGWIHKILLSDAVIIWNLNVISYEKQEKNLVKAARNLKSNIGDETNIVKKRSEIFEEAALDEVIDIISTSKEQIFDSTILFLNRATSKEELQVLEETNAKNARFAGLKINNLIFRQFEGFASCLFRESDDLKTSIEMPASNISFSWPFINVNFNDGNFNLMGTLIQDYSPVFFNQFQDDQNRKNNNMFILGTSGSGKSTLTKKLAIYNLLVNNEIIILDPQNEYAALGHQLGANVVDIGTGNATTINPLQVFNLFNPNSNNDNVQLFLLFEQFLWSFLEILIPNLSEKELRIILRTVKAMYQPKINSLASIAALKNEEYFTFDDLLAFLTKTELNISNEEKHELLEKLDFEFGKHGRLKNLFNGHTNINFVNKFNIFNFASLIYATKNVYQATLFLVLSFVQGRIANNIKKQQKIVLIVDEAHLFVDEKNLKGLDFLFTTAKTIRKFNGGLILTTQNPKDFSISGEAKRKSEAIVDNCQYSIFFNLKSKDVDIVDELYKNSGGLTKQEKQFIASAKIGEFLFTVSNYERFLVDSYYSDLEKEILFDKGNKREEIIDQNQENQENEEIKEQTIEEEENEE